MSSILEESKDDSDSFDTNNSSFSTKYQSDMEYVEIIKHKYQDEWELESQEQCSRDSKLTVKFITKTDKIMFAKAFMEGDSILDVKLQLAKLFSFSVDQIDLKQNDEKLSNDITLLQLGIDNYRNLELILETKKDFIINRQLIYGHMPTVDVINVLKNDGSELIVEIEYQDSIKEWLGGYRNQMTKKVYHHARTQTDEKKQEKYKLSKCLQIYAPKNQSTNTPISEPTQTGCISTTELNHGISKPNYYASKTTQPLPTISNDKLSNFKNIHEIKNICEHRDGQSNRMHLKFIYWEIVRWQNQEKKSILFLNELERRRRNIEILEHTRKFLMKVNHEKRRLYFHKMKTQDREFLLKAATPKIFLNKCGQKVIMDTIETQKARNLQILYNNFIKKQSIKESISTLSKLHDFFSLADEFEFKNDILQLLSKSTDILSKNIPLTINLKQRIRQFILQYIKQMITQKKNKIPNEHINLINITGYRDILVKLQNDEMELFKCFTSICFRMNVMEMVYLVHDIWSNSSILSSINDLKSLAMTRWNIVEEWSPCNCILLTKQEVKQHMKQKLQDYERLLVSEVKNRHLRAKVHFCETLSNY